MRRQGGEEPERGAESRSLLISNVLRTWAPRGQTQVVSHLLRRDKVSVISGIPVRPRRQSLGLYFRLFPCNIDHAEVCQFLRDLLRHLCGTVMALLDNSITHQREPHTSEKKPTFIYYAQSTHCGADWHSQRGPLGPLRSIRTASRSTPTRTCVSGLRRTTRRGITTIGSTHGM